MALNANADVTKVYVGENADTDFPEHKCKLTLTTQQNNLMQIILETPSATITTVVEKKPNLFFELKQPHAKSSDVVVTLVGTFKGDVPETMDVSFFPGTISNGSESPTRLINIYCLFEGYISEN